MLPVRACLTRAHRIGHAARRPRSAIWTACGVGCLRGRLVEGKREEVKLRPCQSVSDFADQRTRDAADEGYDQLGTHLREAMEEEIFVPRLAYRIAGRY